MDHCVSIAPKILQQMSLALYSWLLTNSIWCQQFLQQCNWKTVFGENHWQKKIMFWCSKKGNMRSNIHLLCKKVSNCAGNYKIIWANLATLFQAKIKNDNRCKVPKQQNYNPPSLHLFTFEMGRCTYCARVVFPLLTTTYVLLVPI